jgi:hypothetical protein
MSSTLIRVLLPLRSLLTGLPEIVADMNASALLNVSISLVINQTDVNLAGKILASHTDLAHCMSIETNSPTHAPVPRGEGCHVRYSAFTLSIVMRTRLKSSLG